MEVQEKKLVPTKHQNQQIKGVQSSDSNFPQPRFNHITIQSKRGIYILGGFNSQCQKITNNLFHYYCLEKKVWIKNITNCQLPQFQKFQSKYGTIIGNRVFLLGISEVTNKVLDIWKLNLDTLQWTPQEQRGECPIFREGSCLLNFQKNQMLYFGGDSNGEYSNLIYLYNIDSKYWHICQGNYQENLRSRTEASMLNLNGRIYLFGGYSKCSEGLKGLNDFYELVINPAYKSNPATTTIVKINTQTTPPVLGSSYMFSVNEKDICLLGQNQSVWHFSTDLYDWTEVDTIDNANFNFEGSGWVQEKNNLWKFGGLKESQTGDISVRPDFINISFNWDKFYLTTFQKKRKMKGISQCSPSCKMCYQRQRQFLNPKTSFQISNIESFTQMIEFPFAAFGLLIDNSVSQSSSSIIVKIDKHSSEGQYIIRIDDNARHPWSDDELETALLTLGQSVTPILLGCDKLIKKDLTRKKQVLQFGRNIKIGSLRLGKSFLFISLFQKKLRVGYCCQTETTPHNKQFSVYFYSYDITTKELTKSSMIESKRVIEQKYHKLIKQVLEQKLYTNSIFIFDTILDDPQETIRVELDDNDVFFGSPSDIETLRELGYNIEDSVDVSLRSYLSALFLVDSNLDITFSLHKIVPAYVGIQNILEKMDKVIKSGSALQLKNIFQNQFDFRRAEFYILRDMKKSTTFFNNGLLLYYHNRLITRFKPQLGTMIQKLLGDTSGLFNCVPLFGYAQLPEGVECNLFKTNFAFQIMLEGLYSRFKMVEEKFKKKILAIQSFLPKEALKRREKKPELAAQPIKQLPWKLRGARQNVGEGKGQVEESPIKTKKKRYNEQYDSSYEAIIKLADSEEKRNNHEDRRKRFKQQ